VIWLKIALFGGTFDPVHNGHVQAAESIMRFTGCKEVWFIPVYWHAFKANGKVTDIAHRKKMLEIAVAGKKGMRVVDFNENPAYTIDTIRKAKKSRPGNEYAWAIGSDLVQEFPAWKDAGLILCETKIIIVPEPGIGKFESKLLNEKNSVVLWDAPRVGLNSTAIRKKLERGESVSGLLDGKVLAYIKKNNLYKK